MRVFAAILVVLGAVGCGQKSEHPDAAPGCEASGRCFTPPATSSGSGSQGGEDSGSGEEFATFSGQIIGYADDFFQQGSVLASAAQISATGASGARVRGSYDGTSFQLENVLKSPANWFLVEPSAAGLLPTVVPVDTRSSSADVVSLGVAPSLIVDGLFVSLGTERSGERAQVVLRVVDSQGRSVVGVKAALTAERIAYRTASTWLSNDEGTDDSGLIFLGNVQVSAALTTTTIALSGAASGRVEVAIVAGATSIATAVVTKK